MRGERESGNTLLWLAEGVDEGDVIAQRSFPITLTTPAPPSTRRSPHQPQMLLELLPPSWRASAPAAQERSDEPILARRPADGRINWDCPPARSTTLSVR